MTKPPFQVGDRVRINETGRAYIALDYKRGDPAWIDWIGTVKELDPDNRHVIISFEDVRMGVDPKFLSLIDKTA